DTPRAITERLATERSIDDGTERSSGVAGLSWRTGWQGIAHRSSGSRDSPAVSQIELPRTGQPLWSHSEVHTRSGLQTDVEAHPLNHTRSSRHGPEARWWGEM